MAERKISEKSLENLKRFNQENKAITRESIEISLLQLLEKKDFKKITISELVERAGVSRAAFYRNYGSKEEILKLAAIAKKHDIFLIFDEVYREFVYDGAQHFSVMQVPNIEQNAIMIDSVSKRFSMCGARIGWVVSKNKEVMKSILKFAQARLSPPTYSQIGAEKAFDVPETYFEEVLKEYTQRRNVLIKALQKIEGVRVSMPKGAFYCIAELPIENAEDFCIWLLDCFSVENETVMLAPAEGFYASPGLGRNQVRIAYVLEKEKIERAVEILKKGLECYKRR